MMTAIALGLIAFGLLLGYAGVTGQHLMDEIREAFRR